MEGPGGLALDLFDQVLNLNPGLEDWFLEKPLLQLA
jgi:hypothetical protein